MHHPRVTFAKAPMSSLPGSPSFMNPLKNTAPSPAEPSEPSSSGPSTPLSNDDLAFFEQLRKPVDSLVDDGPPAAPSTAYPSPNPPNPVREAGQTSEVLQRNRDKEKYGLYVKATRNNTLITLTRPNGTPLVRYTGGKVGFKGQRRSTYEAGYLCAVRTFERIEQVSEELQGKLQVWLYLNGFGQGRDAVYRALMATEGVNVRPLVTRVTDKTPIKVGGTRAKKMRRT